jgi:hypothetical protein
MNLLAAPLSTTHPTLDDVCDFFRTSPYPHLVHYVSQVQNGEVALEGETQSFHSKQLAQNVAARCPGVNRVRNHIRVNYAR